MNNENPKLVQENAEYPMLRLLKDLPAAALLTEIMTSLYNITIMVWDENGTILCANDVVARGFRRKSVDELLGKTSPSLGLQSGHKNALKSPSKLSNQTSESHSWRSSAAIGSARAIAR